MCSRNMADCAAIGTRGTIGHSRMTTEQLNGSHSAVWLNETWGGRRNIPIVIVTGQDVSDLNPDEFACVLRKPISPER